MSKSFKIEHEFPCGCVVVLKIGGEMEPVVIETDSNEVVYCEEHGQGRGSESFSVEIEHMLKCGCEIELTALIATDEDHEVEKVSSDIDYCDEHEGGLTVPDAALRNLTLLAEGKHHISCSQDQWCDCRTHLASSALATLGAI